MNGIIRFFTDIRTLYRWDRQSVKEKEISLLTYYFGYYDKQPDTEDFAADHLLLEQLFNDGIISLGLMNSLSEYLIKAAWLKGRYHAVDRFFRAF